MHFSLAMAYSASKDRKKGEDSLLNRGHHELMSKPSFLKTSANVKLQFSNEVEEFESRTSIVNLTCNS